MLGFIAFNDDSDITSINFFVSTRDDCDSRMRYLLTVHGAGAPR